VPAIWPLEFANVLRTACVRQRMTAAQAQAVVAQINPLQITVDSHPVSPAELLALSLRFALSAHDASCLELALCLQCPTATQDEDLRPAAQVSGVGVMASA
jgi:predicted nucleic acid-binding protein